ncbi:sarcosine oxidase subunit alpha [Edaphobacillus lindanitolerans]|uniref:Sarcosine oxidase subunit alpha n=1 Tax=Edaphobacillus lindanitolerans TaxID=550447 RepID=A0A1U7PL89_9BACI|nr:sarcosine oxidase subunit alpha [Edaphobacillus lindanitolerans]
MVSVQPQAYVSFSFNGTEMRALKGQTIAAALLANGIRKLGVSRKLRQPRGIFCHTGRCCSCFVTVDGIDHVLSCMKRIEEGMKIEPGTSDPVVWRSGDGD